jgi:hypothetical protein
MAHEKKFVKEPMKEIGLVGRCFHVFGDDGRVLYQGIVRGQIDEKRYLIQFFEFFMGQPAAMRIVPIEMITTDPFAWQRGWQFYEDDDHMRFWYETVYQKPEKKTQKLKTV